MSASRSIDSVSVIIPAAGRGERLGHNLPKAFVPLSGRPMIAHALDPFLTRSDLLELVIAFPPETKDPGTFLDHMAVPDNVGIRITEGGETRFDSVKNGFNALESESDAVLIHDAARPLVSGDVIERVVRGVEQHDAVIAAMPIPDTIKRVRSNVIRETVDRREMYLAQTPQGFRTNLYLEALQALSQQDRGHITDDAGVVSAAGFSVHVVRGDRINFKITYREDLERAERLLEASE